MPRFSVSRTLPFQPEPLFDLAADVERYPEFLPWWLSATILRREGNVYYTEQVVGLGPVRQRFGTMTVLQRPTEIVVSSVESVFEMFDLTWRFEPLQPAKNCTVSLTGEIRLRAPLLRSTLNAVVARSAGSILSAFEERAHAQLGASA